MVKISINAHTLPVYLITGLLGSGKTSALKHLLQQKSIQEQWGIIINEFGEVDIDAASLSASQSNTQIRSVAGGCICCSAQHGLRQAIEQLLNVSKQTPLTRLFIEPTGLGHPAKIIDLLLKQIFSSPLSLQRTFCIITPAQLTPDRWQRSAVMRDLVTLADTIVLNKIDLSPKQDIQQALSLLDTLYPKKTEIIQTQYSQISLEQLLKTRVTPTLKIFSPPNTSTQEHTELNSLISKEVTSQLPFVLNCTQQVQPKTSELHSIGWVFSPQIQFNRTKLKIFFGQIEPILLRGKGLLKTGNEWQLIQWSQNSPSAQLTFEEIAWRQDSRLELIFKPNEQLCKPQQKLKSINTLEQQLHACLVNRNPTSPD